MGHDQTRKVNSLINLPDLWFESERSPRIPPHWDRILKFILFELIPATNIHSSLETFLKVCH